MASLRIGSAFGIPIELGTSFLLVVPVLAYLIGSQVGTTVELLSGLSGTTIDADPLTAGAVPWLLGLTAALGLFASVLVHEFGHALVGRRYGHEVESITLWFLGGLARFTAMPEDWRQELAIAAIGPLVSLAIGLACYGAFVVTPETLPAVQFLLGYLAVLNVALAAFNVLPGFPMDGGRVLRALLSRTRSRARATQLAAAVGKGFAVLLALGGVVTLNLFWLLIAFFIFVAASAETRQVVTEAALEGLLAEDVMTPAADLETVTPATSVETLLDRMLHERHTGYPVLEDGRLVGIVTLEDLEDRVEDPSETAVRDVMTIDPVSIPRDVEATQALGTIQREDVGRLLVTDADGSLAGLVSRTDLVTVLEIAASTPSARRSPRSAEW